MKSATADSLGRTGGSLKAVGLGEPSYKVDASGKEIRHTEQTMNAQSRTSRQGRHGKAVAYVVVAAACLVLGVVLGKLLPLHFHGAASSAPAAGADQDVLYWTCSMHPQVKLPKAGQCPICFMDLIPVKAGDSGSLDENQLALSPRAKVLAQVETQPVQRRGLEHEVRMVGKVAVDETRITYISSYVPGRIDRLFVNYTGIFVKKGVHLAEIYSPEVLVAQREYLLALDAVESGKKGTTQPVAVRDATDAMLQAARRKLQLWAIPEDQIAELERLRKPLDHIRIDAPEEGWVTDRQGYEGMYVETGTRIFTLADLRTVWVLLDAYELEIGFIHYGQQVQFETEAYPGQVFTGRIAYIDPVLNEATRTVKVRVTVPNSEMKLRPGMFVRAKVTAAVTETGKIVDASLAGKWISPMHPEIVKDGPGKCDVCGMDLVPAESLGFATSQAAVPEVLVIPQTAVLLTGTRAVVYVETQQNDQPVYESREVRLGMRAGDNYVVLEGLDEGERIVTRGAFQIDSAMQIQAKPSMMQAAEEQDAETRGRGDRAEDDTETRRRGDAGKAGSARQSASAPKADASRYVAGAMYHDHFKPVLQAYFDLAAALVAGDADKSTASTAALRKALSGVIPHGLPAGDEPVFKKYVAAIGDSLPKSDKASVEQLRQQLPAITAALRSYLRAFGHNLGAPVYRIHCPMAFDNKGADWLSPDDKVLNPYFGDKMLRCGEVVGQIAPDGRESR